MVSEKVKALARGAHENICPNSDTYTFERGYIHGYEDAIDKACEWIETHTTIFDTGVSPESFMKDMSE